MGEVCFKHEIKDENDNIIVCFDFYDPLIDKADYAYIDIKLDATVSEEPEVSELLSNIINEDKHKIFYVRCNKGDIVKTKFLNLNGFKLVKDNLYGNLYRYDKEESNILM